MAKPGHCKHGVPDGNATNCDMCEIDEARDASGGLPAWGWGVLLLIALVVGGLIASAK